MPPRYARCTLDNFVLYPNERLIAAVTQARRFADAFPAVQKGLCLIGPPGIGKTHIAVAVLQSRRRRTSTSAGCSTTCAICCA